MGKSLPHHRLEVNRDIVEKCAFWIAGNIQLPFGDELTSLTSKLAKPAPGRVSHFSLQLLIRSTQLDISTSLSIAMFELGRGYCVR